MPGRTVLALRQRRPRAWDPPGMFALIPSQRAQSRHNSEIHNCLFMVGRPVPIPLKAAPSEARGLCLFFSGAQTLQSLVLPCSALARFGLPKSLRMCGRPSRPSVPQYRTAKLFWPCTICKGSLQTLRPQGWPLAPFCNLGIDYPLLFM